MRVRFETEQAERERELLTLKNDELAAANRDLERLTASLRAADEEKTALLVRLEKHAHEDALTGLANRRHFDTRLVQEFRRANRSQRPLSVALCDLDDFKEINDRFSHTAGDVVLRTLATLFTASLRDGDVVARIGGEEFALILPETAGPEARAICERLRHDIEAYPWHQLYSALQVTVSVGLTDDTTVANAAAMLAVADTRLYKAKRRGKNQVATEARGT